MNGKKHLLRALAFVLTLCSIAVMFTGCGETANVNAYRSVNGVIPESQVLASNSNYELSWDEDGTAVVLKSVKDGKYWSDILYESFLAGSYTASGNSPISVTVANTKTLDWNTETSSALLDAGGNVVCKKIDKGIRVTYFFEKYEIAIPVDYTLRDNCLNITVDASKILENGDEYKLVSISLAPYMCSVKNDAENGYLLVPSGSGALMYSKETPEGAREFESEMYGDDGARQIPSRAVDYEATRLPVFGAAGGGSGIFGIIEKGAGAAFIKAKAGYDKLGYSNIYADFYVRGYDTFSYEYHGKPQGTRKRVNENISQQKISVSFYPLSGEEANYNGMAKKYREYLIESGSLKKTEISSSAYGLTILGGTSVTKSILGIPKDDTVALTTFAQANTIISELKTNSGVTPDVLMSGYGDKGMNSGTIAGGKKYLSVYGSKKDLTNLIEENNGNNFFIDSDIVTYAKSGSGYSLSGDVAKTAIKYKAEHFHITPTRVMDKKEAYYIISRENLPKVLKLALKKAEKYGNKGIALSTLGSIAYSDYNSDEYISKNGIEKDVWAIINNAQKDGYKVAVSDANSYAACAADVLFDISTTSAKYSTLDEEVPFYQLVFHSYKPMYTDAINLDENIDLAVARAAAYGMGLGYTLSYNYQDESDDLDEYALYGTLYDDNAELICNSVKSYNKIYTATKDAELASYSLLENGVSETKYSNGVTVYTNLTNSKVDTPVGSLEPYAFKMK